MTRSDSSRSGLTVALVLLGAAVFGLVALPRLGKEPLIGSHARDFALARLEAGGPGGASGEPVRLSDLAGKAVILDFWASWCLPCREQAPIVDRVARSFKERGLVALGIVTDDSPESARRFLASEPVGYPSLLDEQRAVASAFEVRGLPTLVVLDRAGRVVAVRRGLVREKELVGLAEAALAE